MANSTIRVEGLRNLARIVRESDEYVDDWLRDGLLKIGEHVAVDVRERYSPYSARGAEAIKAKVARTGTVIVAQTLRRGRDMRRRRANFGGLMMSRAFLPALDRHKAEVEASAEELLLGLERTWNV